MKSKLYTLCITGMGAAKMNIKNQLGHRFLILCLSKLSRGHFGQSVGRANKEKIKKHNFFYSSWRPQRLVGQNKNFKKFNEPENSISLSAIRYRIELRQKFGNNVFVVCTSCASRKVVCHFCGTIGC